MAINLKKTDVVIVGLGAVGGVAALPLARAGLDVIGLEAGTWLAPDGLCARRAAEQRPRLAAGGAEGESRDSDASAERVGAVLATAGDSSDDERRSAARRFTIGRRAGASIRGTSKS